LCFLWLILLIVSETYSAAATALDNSSRLPVWEAKFGWLLFILPCELIAGVFFLTKRAEKARLGFWLVVLNTFMYAGFACLDGDLVHATWDRVELEVVGGWVLFLLIAIAAAHLLERAFSTQVATS
jgi:hypothetical protein